MALPSMGTTAMRWFTNRPRTTTAASASGSLPASSRWPAARLEPSSSNWIGAPFGQRGLGVDHGGQRLVVDEHGLGGVLGLGDRLGHDGHDRLADEADLAVGQRRPRAGRVEGHAEGVEGREVEVGVGEGGDDAGEALRLADVDPGDDGVGVGRAHEGHVEQSGHGEVADERAPALEELGVLHPHDFGSEERSGHVGHTTAGGPCANLAAR